MRFLPCRSLQNLQYGFNWQPQAQQNGFPSTQLVWDTLLNIHVFTGAYFTYFFTRSKTLILYHPMCLCQMTRWIPPLNHKVYWLHPQELLLGTPRYTNIDVEEPLFPRKNSLQIANGYDFPHLLCEFTLGYWYGPHIRPYRSLTFDPTPKEPHAPSHSTLP